jgi:hypothetical protein
MRRGVFIFQNNHHNTTNNNIKLKYNQDYINNIQIDIRYIYTSINIYIYIYIYTKWILNNHRIYLVMNTI